MKIHPSQVSTKKFKNSFNGYNPQEVRSFLNEVAYSMEALQRDIFLLKENLVEMEIKMSQYKNKEERFDKAITSAAEIGDNIKKSANKEAETIISIAREKAGLIGKDARESLKSLYTEITDLRKMKIEFEAQMASTLQIYQHLFQEAKKVGRDSELSQKELPKMEELQKKSLEPKTKEDSKEGRVTFVNSSFSAPKEVPPASDLSS